MRNSCKILMENTPDHIWRHEDLSPDTPLEQSLPFLVTINNGQCFIACNPPNQQKPLRPTYPWQRKESPEVWS